MVNKEVAFLGVEQDVPFGEDWADTGKTEDEGNGIIGEEEDIIDDLTVAGLDEVDSDFGHIDVGKLFTE